MTEPAPVLIIGAASDIGIALAYEYAKSGAPLVLAARNVARLTAVAADLKLRHETQVRLIEFDILDIEGQAELLDHLCGAPRVAVCVVGLLGDQESAQTNPIAANLIMRSNYNCPALLMSALAAQMESRGSGTLIGISSVAGDRGRASNYIYGSAKAGFTAFLSGLRNRLAGKGVHVLTVKPGFVNTRMTAGLTLPKRLTAEPGEVARAIVKAAARGTDVIYVYPVWRLIMTVIRLLPERIFKKTRL